MWDSGRAEVAAPHTGTQRHGRAVPSRPLPRRTPCSFEGPFQDPRPRARPGLSQHAQAEILESRAPGPTGARVGVPHSPQGAGSQ